MTVNRTIGGVLVVTALLAGLCGCAGAPGVPAGTPSPNADLEKAAESIWQQCGGSIEFDRTGEGAATTRAAAIQADLDAYKKAAAAGTTIAAYAPAEWFTELLSAASTALPASERTVGKGDGVRVEAARADGSPLGSVSVEPVADGGFVVSGLTFARGSADECTFTY